MAACLAPMKQKKKKKLKKRHVTGIFDRALWFELATFLIYTEQYFEALPTST